MSISITTPVFMICEYLVEKNDNYFFIYSNPYNSLVLVLKNNLRLVGENANILNVDLEYDGFTYNLSLVQDCVKESCDSGKAKQVKSKDFLMACTHYLTTYLDKKNSQLLDTSNIKN